MRVVFGLVVDVLVLFEVFVAGLDLDLLNKESAGEGPVPDDDVLVLEADVHILDQQTDVVVHFGGELLQEVLFGGLVVFGAFLLFPAGELECLLAFGLLLDERRLDGVEGVADDVD